jgi:integrase
LSDVANEWINAQVQLKSSTRSGYRFSLDRHVLPRWGSSRVVDVEHGEIQTWVGGLSQDLAPSTVRQIYLVLAGVLKYAVRDGRIPRSPAENIHLPRVVKKKRGYLSHEQVAALAAECGQSSTVILTLAYTGLRWGEMAALTPEELDISRGRIEVASSLSEVRGELVWSTPKTHGRRSVPIPAFLGVRLGEVAAERGKGELLFRGAGGAPLRSGNFRNRVFDAAVTQCRESDATFPKVTVHDLRHTAASLAISAGANVKAVQRMLGHASAAMTLDVYADLFEDDLDAVATALNSLAVIHL